MPEYKEVEKVVTVPKGTGIDGFLEAIRKILRRPRVQEVVLGAEGSLRYRRFTLEDEPEDEPDLDLDSFLPYFVLQRVLIQELPVPPDEPVLTQIWRMFAAAAADGLNAIGFTCGGYPTLLPEYPQSTSIFGLPVWVDHHIPPDSLILLAAFTRQSTLLGTQKAYKISLPITRK